MRLTSCLSIIWLMPILSYANATKGKYTVIAPGTIHCNEKYTAAVAVHHTTQPCRIKVGLSSSFHKETKQVEVTQNEVKHVEFLLPCFEDVNFNLTAEGIDCLDNFKNSTKLIYKKFNNHVIIQTAKNFYSPGDDINFRVLFLDKDLRPAQPEKYALIWIADGMRNRIKEITNFKTINGVYSGVFKISEFPVLGGWHLGVKNGGQYNHILHFEVDKYKLPNFVVTVQATESVSFKDGALQVDVSANYIYGKPLNGKVTVSLFLESYNYYEDMKPPILIKTTKMVKGKAKLDININEYKSFLSYEISPPNLTIVATVEENFTGVKINGTTSTTIYPYCYAINCINYNGSATFEGNKENDVLFQITYLDGSYLNDTSSTIELIYKETLRKNQWWHRERTLDYYDAEVVASMLPHLTANYIASFKGHMNETGFVNFKVALPDLPQYEGYLHYYSLELKYLDEQQEICNTHLYWDQKQFNSPKKEEHKSKEYFRFEDKYWYNKKLYLKKASKFTLNSSHPLFYFDYNVIGRGNILESGRVILPEKPKVYNLTLTPQFSWAPSFCLYVNYVDANGEYHYVEQPYEVVLELENQIIVTATKQVKPGEEVYLKIQTLPNSFVGLMAIDENVFLSRADNDLNFYELSRLLSSFSTYTTNRAGYSTYPGEKSGCVTLTNADYFYRRTWPKNTKRDFMPTAIRDPSIYSSTGEARDSTNLKALKGFSQAWFFTDIENTEAAEFMWPIKTPETINSWMLVAFSLNPQKGLAVAMETTKITTFRPIFISVQLPYAVKRGEVIKVPVWVSNYLDESIRIDLTLDNTDKEYEFIVFDNDVINGQKLSKSISVSAKGSAGVYFLLKPIVVGNIVLNLTAISPVSIDNIRIFMKVVAEGVTQYVNRAYFVNLKNESEFKTSFELILPQNFVPNSKHVEVGVMGDILGPVLSNLGNLVRLPTGCAEQVISSLLNNYLVIKYLKGFERLTPNMEIKLRYNMETGYQSILNYPQADGSFSNFIPLRLQEKRNGSTWLTAYVVRSLLQIKEFIHVDDEIIEYGLDYLSKQQAPNGTFIENDDYFCASQRNHVTLTCSAVLAIMESPIYAEKYSEELVKGLDFIAKNIAKSDSLHAQAIGTFTLNKAKREAAKAEIYKLKALAKIRLDRTWWSTKKPQFGHNWWNNASSNDIEITSYALLTLLDQYSTKIDDVLPIVNWLISQRNSYGGFATTQDTVLGLTALIEFAQLAGYKSAKMRVDIESQKKKETINLTEDNGILYHNIEMPPKTKSISFTAKGTGTALVQIAYQYNVLKEDLNSNFRIKTAKMYNTNTPLRVHIMVCVTYVGEGDSSNMAILEMSTLTSFVIDDESFKEIRDSRRVINTELKHSGSLLVVYFDHLYTNYGVCFIVEALRVHEVYMQKPASIVLYDYYDTSKRATAFYAV